MRNPIYNGINDSIKDEAYREAVKAERDELIEKDKDDAKFTTREE